MAKDEFLAPPPLSPPETGQGTYNIFPVFPLDEAEIKYGFSRLADELRAYRTILLDGFSGVIWSSVKQAVTRRLETLDFDVNWLDIRDLLLPETKITDLLKDYLGGSDPLFGRRCPLDLEAFFQNDWQEKIKKAIVDNKNTINIIAGTGAFLCGIDGFMVYIDIPKSIIIDRSRKGIITNLGMTRPEDSKSMYKRFYFVDWQVLNRHKRRFLPAIELMIDGQRDDLPVFTSGTALRGGLDKMIRNFVRLRPWFQPAPWGGGYMKDNFPHLPAQVPNYGWSYDIIAPENGITFKSRDITLEVSFDFLMYHDGAALMGKHVFSRFDCEWPVRIDYLDTMDGGNLSIQCHPQLEYIRENFGEKFTQDECYYIMDCKNQARVYLGFQEIIDPQEFREALQSSQNRGTALDVDRYVYSVPAKKHDLYLIPAGTIHASGKDNLVLEISATTYNFTFKMYDWQRLDLDGKPRPINIERAFANLVFERRGQYVPEHLVAHPYCLESGENWRVIHLPTHEQHFYDVHRIEFSGDVTIRITEDSFHVLTLAEGNAVQVTSENGLEFTLNYLETMIIPCAAGSYSLKYAGEGRARVIKTFVK